MIALICFVLAVVASPFKSKGRLEAENAVLRHQLIVLRRKVRGRAQLTNNDHWFLVQMYRWFPSIRYNESVIKDGAGTDLLIHEVAMARPALMEIPAVQRILAHHTTPKEAGMVFSKAKPKLAVYTHIVLQSNAQVPEPTLDDLVAETRQTYSGPLEVGEDLTSFEIGDTVIIHRFKQ
jgi:hypothetical protein